MRKQAGPADGELVMGLSDLCGDGCSQQLFGCPFSLPLMDNLRDPGSGSCQSCPSAPLQLQSQPSHQSSQWADESPPSCHDDHHLPGFYQLHMRGGPFVSEGPDCGTAGAGTGGLQVEFSLCPSASPPSSAVLPSHFQAFGSLLHPSPVQHPRSLTQ